MSIRSAEDWRELIARHKASGLSLKAFCNQTGIGYDWFCLKRKRILSESSTPTTSSAPPGFVKAQPLLTGGIEIRLGELICRLPTQTPAGYVAELLRKIMDHGVRSCLLLFQLCGSPANNVNRKIHLLFSCYIHHYHKLTVCLITLFVYGPNKNRVERRDWKNGQIQRTVHYLGDFEKVIHNNGKIDYRHTLGGLAILTLSEQGGNETSELHYLHKDPLGSLFAQTKTDVTQQDGITHFRFDAWGQRENPDGTPTQPTPDTDFRNEVTDRGYTGHEHLDDVGIIHMNGRVYSPETGRFLSPDPLIQAPEYSQSFNRYSYVWNNPLNNIDPSGYASTKQHYPQTVKLTGKGRKKKDQNSKNEACDADPNCKTSGSTDDKKPEGKGKNGNKKVDPFKGKKGYRKIDSSKEGVSVTFENDVKDGPSTDNSVYDTLAGTIEKASKDTKLELNLNSTTGGHKKGPHTEGRAGDINKINKSKVKNYKTDKKVKANVKKLVEALIKDKNVNQILSPYKNVNTWNGKVVSKITNKKLIEQHKDHIHVNVRRK